MGQSPELPGETASYFCISDFIPPGAPLIPGSSFFLSSPPSKGQVFLERDSFSGLDKTSGLGASSEVKVMNGLGMLTFSLSSQLRQVPGAVCQAEQKSVGLAAPRSVVASTIVPSIYSVGV